MGKTGRILSLDGYRAIAALGVVWIHVWGAFGNPSLFFVGIDIYKGIAILGNGVDLFFVISGFCMYLVYTRQELSLRSYVQFVIKRWKRIAPAYYAAVIIYGLIRIITYSGFPVLPAFITHLLFIHTYFPNYEISAPFWSIAAEWHFYVILPAIFVLKERRGIIITVCFFSLLSLIAGCFFYFPDPHNWSTHIEVRLIEFMWGILIANFYLNPKRVCFKYFSRLYNSSGFRIFIGFIVAYAGRLFMTTEVVDKFGSINWLVRAFATPLMTLGFAIMILNTISNQSTKFAKLLSTSPVVFLGKISYSIYLWHSIVLIFFERNLFPLIKLTGSIAPLIGFLVVCAITIPLSYFSYKIFEEYYFKDRQQVPISIGR